jgi:hypothetical protein
MVKAVPWLTVGALLLPLVFSVEAQQAKVAWLDRRSFRFSDRAELFTKELCAHGHIECKKKNFEYRFVDDNVDPWQHHQPYQYRVDVSRKRLFLLPFSLAAFLGAVFFTALIVWRLPQSG